MLAGDGAGFKLGVRGGGMGESHKKTQGKTKKREKGKRTEEEKRRLRDGEKKLIGAWRAPGKMGDGEGAGK
jgi:hypothetical protein